MINVLVELIIFCIVGGLLYYLVTLLPLPEPFMTVVRVAVIIIFILIVLSMFFGGATYLPHLGRWQ